MVAQTAVAALLLFTLGWTAIGLGIVSLIPVVVYPFAKRFTWWPQVFLGVAFNWGVWLAWAAHGAPIGVATALLYLSGIAWTLFYDTIYAHQDKEDDALIGVKSTARLFAHRTREWLAGFLAATVVLAGLAVILTLDGAAMVAALLGVAAFGAHMVWQLFSLRIDDPDHCLRLFRSNRDAGLILALFLAGAAIV